MNLEELFASWVKDEEFKFFVKDVIICEEVYASQTTKILFVLRDAHIAIGQEAPYNLRESLSNFVVEGRTWNNVARWTRALLEDYLTFEEVKQTAINIYHEIRGTTPETGEANRITSMNWCYRTDL